MKSVTGTLLGLGLTCATCDASAASPGMNAELIGRRRLTAVDRRLSAFEGDATSVPGTYVMASHFDDGGHGVAYSDTTMNDGEANRPFRPTEDVDLVEKDGSYYVGYTASGEWLRYTVDVEEAADRYDFKVVVATQSSDGALQMVSGATDETDPCNTYTTDLTGVVTIEPTGGWENFVDVEVDTSSVSGVGGLDSGEATIWVCITGRDFNIFSFGMITPEGPYDGSPHSVPGDIEAVHYDFGGKGVAYEDFSPGNFSREFRPLDDVDFEEKEGGYTVGFINTGDWLRYTVDLSEDVGRFNFKLVTAAGSGDGIMEIITGPADESDPCGSSSTTLSGVIDIPQTGGWADFQEMDIDTSSVDGVGGLDAGETKIWVCVINDGFNFDSFNMIAAAGCTTDNDCDAGEVCCETKNVCEPDTTDPGACGDPHMTGFRGQKFDFTGQDDGWYSVLSDLPSMHLNMRVTAPVPSVPEITYITGISIKTRDAEGLDHTIAITVTDPHTLESACPVGVSRCLADGALTVELDGEEAFIVPGEAILGPDVAISAANLPGACRSFGFEKYWERKKAEYAAAGRRLSADNSLRSMAEWILDDPTATNMLECAEYVAKATAGGDAGLFAHASEHTSFQILTPMGTIRLSHGRLHQLPMRDPTDQYDLPDHTTWQMNLAIDHRDVSIEATGILGETLVPTVGSDGKPIMQGMESIRGKQEDYRVEGPFETAFAQASHHE